VARYSSDHRSNTRKTIITLAAKALREKGFNGVGIADVMSAAGLTHGGFYAHFKNREELLQAAFIEAFAQSPINFGKLARLAEASGDIALIADSYLDQSKIDDVANGCVAAALASEMHRQGAAIQAILQAGTEQTVHVIQSIEALEDAGWATLAMLIGAKSLMRAIPDPALSLVIKTEVINAVRKMAAETN
jgi:TetR/AcrR family transcriptional regulator, transcriptional repressor for nem operon